MVFKDMYSIRLAANTLTFQNAEVEFPDRRRGKAEKHSSLSIVVTAGFWEVNANSPQRHKVVISDGTINGAKVNKRGEDVIVTSSLMPTILGRSGSSAPRANDKKSAIGGLKVIHDYQMLCVLENGEQRFYESLEIKANKGYLEVVPIKKLPANLQPPNTCAGFHYTDFEGILTDQGHAGSERKARIRDLRVYSIHPPMFGAF